MLKLSKNNHEIIQVKNNTCVIYRNKNISIFFLEDKVDVLFLYLRLNRSVEDLNQPDVLNKKVTLYHKMLNELKEVLDVKTIEELIVVVNDRFRNDAKLLEDNSLYSQELNFFLDIIKEITTSIGKMDSNSWKYKTFETNPILKQAKFIIESDYTTVNLYESSMEFEYFNLFIQLISADSLAPFLNSILNKKISLRIKMENKIGDVEIQTTKNKNEVPSLILKYYNKEKSTEFKSEIIYNKDCTNNPIYSLEYNGAILELIKGISSTRIKVTSTFTYRPTSLFEDTFEIISDYKTGDVYLKFNLKDGDYYILINDKTLDEFEEVDYGCNLRDAGFIDIISKNNRLGVKDSSIKYKNIGILEKNSRFFYNILHSVNLLRNPKYFNYEIEETLISISNNIVYSILTSKWIDINLPKDSLSENKSGTEKIYPFKWD